MCRYCEPYDEEADIRRIVNEELDRREAEERQRSDEVSRRMQQEFERNHKWYDDYLNDFDVDRNSFVFLREGRPSDRWEPELPAEPSKPCTDGWIHDCEVDTKCDFVPAGFVRCGYCGVERP